jgi:hypothetical protein
MRRDDNCNVPPMTGSSPRTAFSRVDLPHPTGPTTMVIFPRGTIMLMPCRVPDGLFLSHPKSPFSMTTAWQPAEFISLNSTDEWSFCETTEFFSESESIITLGATLLWMEGNLRLSGIASMEINSWILLNEPTPPMSADRANMRELRGSARSVKRESEVKTVAVSRVLWSFLAASIENTAKARIGDTIGEM